VGATAGTLPLEEMVGKGIDLEVDIQVGRSNGSSIKSS